MLDDIIDWFKCLCFTHKKIDSVSSMGSWESDAVYIDGIPRDGVLWTIDIDD